MFVLFGACLLCFLIAFVVSTLQYGHNTTDQYKNGFGTSYLILLKCSPAFYIYGFCYGILALCLFYYFHDKGYGNDTEAGLFGLGAAVGFGINGATNISLYNLKSGDQTISFGPKLVVDFVNKSAQPYIKADFSQFIVGFINKAEQGVFKNMSVGELGDHLCRFLPIETTIADKSAFKVSASGIDKNYLLRLFVQQYNLEHLKLAMKDKMN